MKNSPLIVNFIRRIYLRVPSQEVTQSRMFLADKAIQDGKCRNSHRRCTSKRKAKNLFDVIHAPRITFFTVNLISKT